jgi:rubrerythrin
MYQVQFFPYTGLSTLPETFDSRRDAREYAAERLRRIRKRYQVATLTRGASWETIEPDGLHMIPDSLGVLSISHVLFECRECGYCHETREEMAECCQENRNDYDDYA